MVPKKRKTKRITLKLKYKIQKKVKDHHKKLKKEKKKHPEKFRKRTKDPGVPKTLPFYDKVIQEAEAAKEAQERRREEAKQRRKEMRSEILAKKRDMGNINELIMTAEARGVKFEAEQNAGTKEEFLTDKSAKAYFREFKKVVEAADVILEVLDARDPAGTRVPQLEAAITSQPSKKLVLVLNKADLVPRDNLQKWLQHLRQEHPAVAFKSSTQVQNSRLAQTVARISSMTSPDLLQSSRCLGADVLLQLLKNYCRNKEIKTAITVGVVGLPNVGKSSLINSLKRSKSCGVGATPGFTKSMQQIQLDSKLQLLDCPGIVLPGGESSDAAAALRNAVKIESLDDPFTPVDAILQRADKKQLMIYYRLPDFKTTEQFLAVLAKRLGKLKRKGIPNKEVAARKVLYDWNTGLIKYYTQPPAAAKTEVGTTLVTELSKEFDIDSIVSEEGSMMSALPTYRPSQTMVVESLGAVSEIRDKPNEDDDGIEEMDDDDDDDDGGLDEEEDEHLLSKEICINMNDDVNGKEGSDADTEKKQRWETKLQEFDPETMSLGKLQKKMAKKMRKEQNRNMRRTDELTQAFQNFSGLKESSDDYDFNDYFGK